MIRLKNVSKFYSKNGMVASGITKVNLELNIGEFVVITGESGSGKSTLLNVISGLDSYEDGELYIDNKETSHYNEKDYENYRRKYVGNIFQNFNLITSYTVYENIELALLLNGYKSGEIKEKINELIKLVNLTKFTKTKVSKLSGGQKQRVSIARALAKDCPIIIADEPTGNLDSKSAKEVIKVLHEISKDRLIVVVTHNYDQLEEYATRKIRMNDGRILEDKVITKIKESNPTKLKLKNITFKESVRLMLRNSVNVWHKFALLTLLFLFITISILGKVALDEYNTYEKGNNGDNWRLNYIDNKRILVKKNNDEAFTNDEINNINELNHVDKFIESDYIFDRNDGFSSSTDIETIYIYGEFRLLNDFEGELDYGTYPSTDDEVILVIPTYQINDPSSLIGQTLDYYNNNNYTDIVVSGIVVSDNYLQEIYISDEKADRFRETAISQYSDISYEIKSLNENRTYVSIYIDDEVKDGEVWIRGDEWNNYLNKTLDLTVKNSKINKTVSYKITKNINSDYIDDKEINNYSSVIMNRNEYETLLETDKVYQGSIYVDDIENIDSVVDELKKLDIYSLPLIKTLNTYDDPEMIAVFNNIVTMLLIILLFYISYFVIKMIMKSRNVYYSTIRMLGANKSVARSLLIGELMILATIAYTTISILVFIDFNNMFLLFIKNNISLSYFIILYLLITGMSFLIGLRYSAKLFKNSIITTLSEEV